VVAVRATPTSSILAGLEVMTATLIAVACQTGVAALRCHRQAAAGRHAPPQRSAVS
jgi:hypothetical protein